MLSPHYLKGLRIALEYPPKIEIPYPHRLILSSISFHTHFIMVTSWTINVKESKMNIKSKPFTNPHIQYL